MEIASLQPTLEANGVRLVGVGLGYNSMDSFMEGDYWKGNEIYVDETKGLYKALGLGQGNVAMVLDKKVRAAKKKADGKGVKGNMKGDGMQLAGTYIVGQDGKVIYEFQQLKFGDHPEPKDILAALNLSEVERPAPAATDETATTEA